MVIEGLLSHKRHRDEGSPAACLTCSRDCHIERSRAIVARLLLGRTASRDHCGADPGRMRQADNPALPHTPQEIAGDVVECARAGASVVHLHVREEDGRPSARVELFRETIALIRRHADLITMVSTGGALGMPFDERMAGLEAAPDLAGVEVGSMNFGADVFVTSPADCRRVIARAGTLKVGLEVEVFDVGHVLEAVRLLRNGELPDPLSVDLVLGVRGGIDASPEALEAMIRPLPTGTCWSITAVGRKSATHLGPRASTRGERHPDRLRGRCLPSARRSCWFECGACY